MTPIRSCVPENTDNKPRDLYRCDSLGMSLISLLYERTCSPSSKYEHRRASALLRKIQNVRICMRKKPIVSVTYENERILIKKTAYLT